MGDPSNMQESRVKFTGTSLRVNIDEGDYHLSDEIFPEDDTSK